MGDQSDIGWCDSTFNSHIGCTKKSEGCANCYAKAQMEDRWHKVKWGPAGVRMRTSEFYWKQPARWNSLPFGECSVCHHRSVIKDGAYCKGCGRLQANNYITSRRRVFSNSLSDLFENRPEIVPWRIDEYKLWVETQNLDWIVLTKYIENVQAMTSGHTLPKNVALGTSAENQERFEERWAILQRVQVGVKFLSVEPMLGPVNLATMDLTGLTWVICGAESGDDRRTFREAWAIDLYNQCRNFGIKFFMKQGSGKLSGVQGHIPDWLWNVKEFPVIGGISPWAMMTQPSLI